MVKLDPIDRQILAELMRDAAQPVSQIAERVGLTQTPCWKRIQRLEASGVVTGRVAIVDPARIGLGLTVFVEIEAPDHSGEWREGFLRVIAEMPEAMDVFRMAGDVDYLLRVVVTDMAAYDAFYKRLTSRVSIRNVTSRFAMERIRNATVYPIAPE